MPRALLLPTCVLILAWAVPAQAQVRRCMDARGVPVYTDRPCDAVQATPRELPPDPTLGATIAGGFAVRGCARRPEQLLDGVRAALEAHDVNRLATWYHWTGTSSGAAKYLMDELEAIARRLLVSVELVHPAPPILPTDRESGVGVDLPDTAPTDEENGVRFTSPPSASDTVGSGEVNLTPFSSPAGPPDAPEPVPDRLRVQQTAGAADIGAVETEFRLVRNAGCWWIEL